MRSPLPFLLAAAVFTAAAPAVAFPEPDLPLLDAVPFDDAFYTAWRVFLPAGSSSAVWMGGDFAGDTPLASFALWYVDAATLEFSALFNPTWYGEESAALHVAADGIGTLASTETGTSPWPIELSVGFVPNADREWILVAMGDFEGGVVGSFRLYGDESVEVLGRTDGTAFLHGERDFGGTANVVAREATDLAGVRDVVVEAKVAHDAQVHERAENRMFAAFWGDDHLDQLETSYMSPEGSHVGQDSYILAAEPPGDYQFRIDRNVDYHDNTPVCRVFQGKQCWRTPTWVLGADVAIP